MIKLLLVVVAIMVIVGADALAASHRFSPKRSHHVHAAVPADRLDARGLPTTPGVANCSERYFTQPLDHFSFVNVTTYQQRYFVCNEKNWSPGGPIFFYTGNECNVELFVNMTGLMWENADKFGALLIFAEHRYFGKSLPFPGQEMPAAPLLRWLTVDQALADYANLIFALRHTLYDSPKSAVCVFGGSYGGMLAAWLILRYPAIVDGAIAASAPIVNFEGMTPPYDPNAFNDVVTVDASSAGGASDICQSTIRQAWQDMLDLSTTAAGRAVVSSAFRTCAPLQSAADVEALMNWASGAFGNMAMSSYPYPSAYLLLGGKGILPAYPMRVGCQFIENATAATLATPAGRMAALREVIGVYFNNSGTTMCFDVNEQPNHSTVVVNYLWDYLACTTMFMPFGSSGKRDMFWNDPWNLNASVAACAQQWDGVEAQPYAVATEYGGRAVPNVARNTVYSQGALDPWSVGGIASLTNASSPSVRVVVIPDVGHHIDLFFSSSMDTPAIRAARELEVAQIGKWIAEKRARSD